MRNRTVDIAKGLGIALVVLGHCSNGLVTQLIYLFHMPMFFLISGYLYSEKSSKQPLVFMKKKFWNLYIPYLLVEVFFTVIRNGLLNIGVYSDSYLYFNHYVNYLDSRDLVITIGKDILLAGREPLAGTLWFSVVLIFVNIMFLVISIMSELIERLYHIKKESVRLFFVFCAFFIGNLATRLGHTIPRCNNALVMLFIYYIGVRIRQCRNIIIYNKLYMFLSILLLVLNRFYGEISVNQNDYLSPVFLITNCLFGTYMVFGVADLIQKNRIGSLFESLGRHSFAIMAFHYSAFMILSKVLLFFLEDNHWYEFPILHMKSEIIQDILVIPYFFVGVFLPYAAVKVYHKIKKKIGECNEKND